MEAKDNMETNGSHETFRLAASLDSHHQAATDKHVVEMTTSLNCNARSDLDDGRQDEDGRHVDFAADPASADADVGCDASRANDPEMNGSHAPVQVRPAVTSTGSHHQAAATDDDVERKTPTYDSSSGIDDRQDEDGRRVDDDAIAIAVDEGDVPREDAQDCDVSDISDSSPSNLEGDHEENVIRDVFVDNIGVPPPHNIFSAIGANNAASEYDAIRIQRANVDRLLMSGGSLGRGGGSSVEGSDMDLHLPQHHRGSYASYDASRSHASSHSPLHGDHHVHHQHQQPAYQHHERAGLHGRQFAHTYDPNYYRAVGDWLRFVPRWSSGDPGGVGVPSSHTSSDPEFDAAGSFHHHHHRQHHPSDGIDVEGGGHVHHRGNVPGYRHAYAAPGMDPDFYYRGFDNTRIRTGFHPGVDAGSRMRRITHPIDEVVAVEDRESINVMPPTEIHWIPNPNVDVKDHEELSDHAFNMVPVDSRFVKQEINLHPDHRSPFGVLQNSQKYQGISSEMNDSGFPLGAHKDTIEHEVPLSNVPGALQHRDHPFGARQESIRNRCVLPKTNSSSPELLPPPPSDMVRYESSLRVGGIICPPSRSSSNVHSPAPITPRMQEQKMNEASWDSKFVTYACRVDQRQEDRSVEITIFSLARPHMRAFHLAWFSFFLAFLAWFAITPLLAEVQKSLDLTKEEIWTSSIFSVAGAVVTRCVTGLLCDTYGARWMTALVLFICGIPTMCTGLVNTSTGLSVLRLFTGIAGSVFVTCQYWTSTMFTREVAGTANALAAGWGNLGGGVAQVFVGAMLFPFFKWIYGLAGTTMDPAEASWRTCCVIPGLMCTLFAFFIVRHSDDHPKGNYSKRKRLSLMPQPSSVELFKAAIRDHNTWLLLIQYGCCFGVELTTSNAAALYFKEEFEMSTEAAASIASIFGWMNLFARGLGGFLSDISNAYRGMRGRLIWQFMCFALEGIFVMVFSKARTLPGAIAALITFSLFVQSAEGSTFGIVPYLNPNVTGSVAGIVGAGGNAGAVFFSIMFRQIEYRDAFFLMGMTTSIVSLLSIFIWIRGYEGLFLKQRVKPTPNEMNAFTIREKQTMTMLELQDER